MKLLITILYFVSNLNAAYYFCPQVSKSYLQELYKGNIKSRYFLAPLNSIPAQNIIKSLLISFPNENLQPKQGNPNKASCQYSTQFGTFIILGCPILTAKDIEKLNLGTDPILRIDNQSKRLLSLFFNNLKKFSGKISSVEFMQNSYPSQQNSCLYNVISKHSAAGFSSVHVNVLLRTGN